MSRFLILLILLQLNGFSQKSYSEVYYPFIDDAENAIIKGKYKVAHDSYLVAFANVRYPLGRDLFNALTCKILLNDFDGAKSFLLRLAARGVPPEVLENEESIMLVAEKWENFKPLYSQIYQDFTPNVSREVTDILARVKTKWPRIMRGGTIVIKSESSVYIAEESTTVSKDVLTVWKKYSIH